MARRFLKTKMNLVMNSNVYTALNNIVQKEYESVEGYLIHHLKEQYAQYVSEEVRDFVRSTVDKEEDLWLKQPPSKSQKKKDSEEKKAKKKEDSSPSDQETEESPLLQADSETDNFQAG